MPETSWPEESWERRSAIVAFDLGTISRMIAPVFAPRDAVSAQLLSGGLANTNYRVRIGGMRQSFVLRLYTQDPHACRKEVEIYSLAHERVPLPAIFYADVAGELMGTPYVLRDWAEGAPLAELFARGDERGDEQVMESAGESAGSVLAAIASYTFPTAGFFGPELAIAEPLEIGPASFLSLLDEWLVRGRAGQRLGPELTERMWRFAERHAPLLDALPPWPVLVHADYKPSNLLMREAAHGWEIAAVLDWEFAFAGPPLFDFTMLLRHAHKDAPFTRGVAHGYIAAGGALPSDWWRLARLLDFLNLTQMLDQPGERPQLTRDASRLIVTTMESWGAWAE